MRTFRRFDEEGHVYLITTNTDRRLPVFASTELAQLAVEALVFYRDRGDYLLHSYVVMPDHMHLLMTALVGTISDAMRNVKSWVAKGVRERTGRCGVLWQSSFHDRAIRTPEQFNKAVQYIHWNPVEAGLVREPEDYRFSSWGWWEVEATVVSGLGP